MQASQLVRRKGLCVQVISSHSNICKQLHMPAQSGSSRVLNAMRRGYTREAYDALIDRVRGMMPKVHNLGSL